MNIGSKSLIKAAAVCCTIFQAWAVYTGQPFSAVIYCTGIATLFGGNTLHEHVQTYLSQKTEVDK